MTQTTAHQTQSITISDVGQKRKLNEDSVLIDKTLGFYIVADGMGGHKAGEVASKLAVRIMHQQIKKHEKFDTLSDKNITKILQDAIEATNHQINGQNLLQGISEGQGMGTTITGFWIPPCKQNTPQVYGFNLGDSRCYSFYQGHLHQISIDHSHYQLWLETGKPDKEPKKNIIYKAMGPWKKVVADQYTHKLRDNELLLLCSDGLSDMLADNEICAILNKSQNNSIKEIAQILVAMANRKGGKDNISIILYKAS